MQPALVAAAFALLSLAVPAWAQEEHLASSGSITIVHPWARAVAAGQDALVFMEIENGGPTDRLLGALTDVAADVRIVGLTLTGDEISIQDVGPVDVANGDFDLDPGGIALELHDVSVPLVQGEHFELVVRFATAGEIRLEVEVEAADANQHSHAGHSH